jgi:Holliday junction resolvase-like predicted endonuclease
MMNTTEAGRLFEKIVAEYFKSKGYEVVLNEEIDGNRGAFGVYSRSGAPHEFDILCRKKGIRGETVMAVECKYVDTEQPIGQDALAYIIYKCEDCKVSEAYLVTNHKVLDSVLIAAKHFNVEIMEGHKLNIEFKRSKLPYECKKPTPSFDGPMSDAVKNTLRLFEHMGLA